MLAISIDDIVAPRIPVPASALPSGRDERPEGGAPSKKRKQAPPVPQALPLALVIRLLADKSFQPGSRPDHLADLCGCGGRWIFKDNVEPNAIRLPNRRPGTDTWVNSGGVRGGRDLKDRAGNYVARRRYGRVLPAGGQSDVMKMSNGSSSYELRYHQYTLVRQKNAGTKLKAEDASSTTPEDPDADPPLGALEDKPVPRKHDQKVEDHSAIEEDHSCRLYHVPPPQDHPSFNRLGIPSDIVLTPGELAEIETAQMYRMKMNAEFPDVAASGTREAKTLATTPNNKAFSPKRLRAVVAASKDLKTEATAGTYTRCSSVLSASSFMPLAQSSTGPQPDCGTGIGSEVSITADQAALLLYDAGVQSPRPANLDLLDFQSVNFPGFPSHTSAGGQQRLLIFRETKKVRRSPRMDRWASSGGRQGSRDMLFSSTFSLSMAPGIPSSHAVGVRRRYGRILKPVSARATGERYHVYTLLVREGPKEGDGGTLCELGLPTLYHVYVANCPKPNGKNNIKQQQQQQQQQQQPQQPQQPQQQQQQPQQPQQPQQQQQRAKSTHLQL